MYTPRVRWTASRYGPTGGAHKYSSSRVSSMTEGESTFSIWLVPNPAEPFYVRVASEIEHWCKQKNTPVFTPHVTLIGGIKGTQDDILGKCESLAKSLKKYSLSIADVDMGQTRHQCVFLRCNTEQSAMKAADTAWKAFRLQPAPYMPHCSLVYSDMPENERQSVVGQARERLYGPLQGYQSLLCTPSFEVSALHVYKTPFPGDEALWEEVGVFPLADEPKK